MLLSIVVHKLGPAHWIVSHILPCYFSGGERLMGIVHLPVFYGFDPGWKVPQSGYGQEGNIEKYHQVDGVHDFLHSLVPPFGVSRRTYHNCLGAEFRRFTGEGTGRAASARSIAG